jgi:autotransporter-associated beta strand protein
MAVEVSGVVAQAANYTNNASGAWSAAGSWSGSAGASAPAAVIVFNPSATDNSTNDNGGAFLLNQMWVAPNQTVNLYESGGSSLLFTNTGSTMPVITNADAGTLMLNTAITMGTNLTIGVGNANGTITIDRNLTGIAGVANSLTKTGVGTLTLTATNHYTGTTFVGGGALTVNGGIITNTAGVTVGTVAGAVASLVVSNGGKVYSTANVSLGNVNYASNNVIHVAGNDTRLDLGGKYLAVGATYNVYCVTGSRVIVDNHGVVTNVGTVYLAYGDSSVGNAVIVTNGGKFYNSSGTSLIGYRYTLSNNWVYVGGNGATWNANQVEIGHTVSSAGNYLMVDGGGTVSIAAQPLVGSSGSGNYMVVTNGGKVFSKSNAHIGQLASANSNFVVIVGNNATWDLGGNYLNMGYGGATGNWMRVDNGGILTNGSSITLGGVGSEFTIGAGGTAWVGNVSVSNGTVLVNGSLSATGTVSVLGNATLGGAGAIYGDVFILAGGILSPDMSGTMAIRSLAFSSQSVLKCHVTASANNKATVSGQLTLPSTMTVNVTVENGGQKRALILLDYSTGQNVGATDLSGWTVTGDGSWVCENDVVHKRVLLVPADGGPVFFVK